MSESTEQQALFQWAETLFYKYAELSLLYAIPNGGKRPMATAIRLKAEGVKPGVPDIFLPVARKGKHGLYIEMKIKGNKLSENQKEWRANLAVQGYEVQVCYGWEAAAKAIMGYLSPREFEGQDWE